MPTAEPICGATRPLDNVGNVVCIRLPSQYAGLDHYDPDQEVRWPICPTYCATDPSRIGPMRHACGRYRGDTQLPCSEVNG